MDCLTYPRELARLHRRARASYLTSPYMHGRVRLALLQCSDGRMSKIKQALGAALGRFFDMRSVGAEKDMASYPFPVRINNWRKEGGEHHVLLLSYHFDCMDPLLGCAGHEFNTQAAIDSQFRLAHDLEVGFRGRIRCLVVGYDTRLEELHLHGIKGQTLRTHELSDSRSKTMGRLACLWPSLPDEILEELVPLFLFNAQHVRARIAAGAYDIPINHAEVGVAIGRRFGWMIDDVDALQVALIEDTTMHPNTEIGVGVYLLEQNLKMGRIPAKDGVFMFSCIPYSEADDMREACEVAAFRWADIMSRIVHERAPSIESQIVRLVAVISEETRALTLLEGPPGARELFHPEMIAATGTSPVEFA